MTTMRQYTPKLKTTSVYNLRQNVKQLSDENIPHHYPTVCVREIVYLPCFVLKLI